MVTAKTQYNLGNARKYFKEHLSVGDYYDEGQRVPGEWFGQGAAQLGLSGKVRADDFLRLCDNQHPATGETLTQRQRATRMEAGEGTSARRVFYDFTFSPPKSVSIAALAGADARILEVHAQAVKSALREFEAFAGTRVRLGGIQADRLTRNFISALFTHETSRALDPHLHTHCIVFNATFDPIETRWKALQNYELLRARKFAENVYYHELAKGLEKSGYKIRNQARGDFQIEGIAEELCERFSKRHGQIDDAIRKLLAEKPECAHGDLMAMRRLVATAERARKQQDLSQTELRTLWNSQMTDGERAGLRRLSEGPAMPANRRVEIAESVQWAEEHLFDRHSVVLECQVWQQALERARGENFTVAELKEFTRQRHYVRQAERPGEVTLREVLRREWEMVQLVKDGIGSCHSLVWHPRPANPQLDAEQRRALDALLGSIHFASLFRGGAGTGKSFVLRELVDQVRESGRQVVVLAPQRQQVVDMETAGFPSPTTVTGFLHRPELPEDALIVVDEAGQIGGRQMLELLRLAKERNARLILSGDTRQHGAVEASDALFAIEKHSGIRPVELHKIRRQDPARGRNQRERAEIKGYRQAVEVAAKGDLPESFARLDKMGAVVACGLGEQAGKLAGEYVRFAEQQASAVVVSQTWDEVQRVNASVREALKSKGLLGTTDLSVPVLDRLDLTRAQKRDERFYPADAVIVFNQKVRAVEPGAQGKLIHVFKWGTMVEVNGTVVSVPNRSLDRLTVCVPREVPVTNNERLHLKANRNLAGGGRVTNGELVTVKSVRADGGLELADGRVLDQTFREFLPGYAVTSYGSQGKTVDYVLFSDSTIKAATNAQQWYVTISRGRRGIRIFTPDKEQLRENVARSGHRPLALDFANGFREQEGILLWDKLRGYLLRFGEQAADTICRLKKSRRHHCHQIQHQKHEHQVTRMLGD